MSFTAATLCDNVRRRLGKTPAIDVGGQSGMAGPGRPRPTNEHIFAAANDALAELNTHTARGILGSYGKYDLACNAQVEPGPFLHDVSGELLSVAQVGWTPIGGSYRVLSMQDESVIQDRYPNIYGTDPTDPIWAWLGGQYLCVFPAMNSSGTLTISGKLCVKHISKLDHIITELPNDLMGALADMIARDLAYAIPEDAEMKSRLQILTAKAEGSIARIDTWMNNQNPNNESNLPRRG